VLQCWNQTATDGAAPLSATIDAISKDFVSKKTSFNGIGQRRSHISQNRGPVKVFQANAMAFDIASSATAAVLGQLCKSPDD
jgi:hypothetical protein